MSLKDVPETSSIQLVPSTIEAGLLNCIPGNPQPQRVQTAKDTTAQSSQEFFPANRYRQGKTQIISLHENCQELSHLISLGPKGEAMQRVSS